MTSTPVRLRTRLSPAECVSRLAAVIDSERLVSLSFAEFLGTKPVIGYVTRTSVRLRKRTRISNSFQTHLIATLTPSDRGATIMGHLRVHPGARAFMVFWLCGVVFIGAPIFVGTLGLALFGSEPLKENAWLGIVVPPLMLCAGLGLVRVGRHLARDEAQFLTDFVVRTLNATPFEDSTPATTASRDRSTT